MVDMAKVDKLVTRLRQNTGYVTLDKEESELAARILSYFKQSIYNGLG